MHPVREALALTTSVVALWIYSSALASILARDPTSIVATSYGGHFQFLTVLSVAASLIHQLFSTLALLTSLRTFATLQSWVLMITAPLEVVVACLYWPMKLSSPGLLKDKRIAFEISSELDRRLHLYPAIFEALSATFFAQRRWRQVLFGPLFLFLGVGGGYWLWIETTFKHNGFYPYPLFAVLDTQKKAAFVGGAVVLAFVAFKIMQAIQRSTAA